MHNTPITVVENPGPLMVAARWRTVLWAMTGIGAVAFALGLIVDPSRAWNDYLISYFMFLCFAVGGLFFTALHYAVNATWVVVTRRVSAGLAAYLPIALVLLFGVYIGSGSIYPWAHGSISADPGKARWLSLPWVASRDVLVILIWLFFAWKIIYDLSLKQDASGDVRLTRRAINWSLVFMPVFAFSFTLISYDLIMSVEPHWFSTMFAVYTFAGLFQSVVALILIIFVWMKRKDGPLSRVATASHVKDLGTLLLAFTIFMTYIGFSQYMLIWYANFPEETTYFFKRQDGGWVWLFALLPLFKFAIPFFGLLSQSAKKNEKWLITICALVLVGQYLDIYWMVMPALHPHFMAVNWMEIGIFLGFAGIFGLSVMRFYTRHSVLAYRDPYILESVNWRFWE